MPISGERKAKIKIESSAAGVDKGLNDARRKMRTFQREQERAAKQAAREESRARSRAARGLVGGLRGAAGIAAGIAGFEIGANLISDVMDVSKEMMRLQIDSQSTAATMQKFAEETMKVSNATGVSRLELVRGAHAYQILTGDAEGAMKIQGLLAETMNATGASTEDVATTLAALQHMKLSPDDYRKAMDILVYQGHKGAIEVRDLAGQMGSLQPMFSAFSGGDSVHGVAELGAAMQEVRKGFGSAEEMSTGLRAAMSALIDPKTQKKLAKIGAHIKLFEVDPKTKKQVPRDFMAIMKDIHDQIGDDPIKLREAFSNIRAFRAVEMMVKNFGEMADLAEQAADSNQVAKDNATYMESAGAKLTRAWEQIKNAVAEALTPDRIERFAKAMMTAGDWIVKAVEAIDYITGNKSRQEDQKYAETQDLIDESGLGKYNANGVNIVQKQAERAAVEKARRWTRGEFTDDDFGGFPAAFANEDAKQAKRRAGTEFLQMEGEIKTYKGPQVVRDTGWDNNARVTDTTPFTDAQIEKLGRMLSDGLARASVNLDGAKVSKGLAGSPQVFKRNK